MRREAKMYSKLMILTLGPSRTAWFRRPGPLLNARALEDVWLMADGVPPGASRKPIGWFRRWRQMVSEPVAASDAIYSP
jgi:hypothetical protein